MTVQQLNRTIFQGCRGGVVEPINVCEALM
jgi:hypothetical protein